MQKIDSKIDLINFKLNKNIQLYNIGLLHK